MTDPERTTGTVQGGTVPLFATPFAALNTGADRHFNERLAGLCESRCAGAGDSLHFQGRDDLLASTDEIAVELKRLLFVNASAVVASVSSIGLAEFAKLRIQAQAWCSIVRRDGHVAARHYSNASWLAVYCVQAGETGSAARNAGVLRLYERRLASIHRDASTADMAPPYRYGNHTWMPIPGWMALFPAHVPHEISVARSDTPLILVFAKIRFLAADDGGNS